MQCLLYHFNISSWISEPILGKDYFSIKADPAWAEEWKDPLFHILRDIAEPSGADPHYTLTR